MFTCKIWILIGLILWLPFYSMGEYVSKLWADDQSRWWLIPVLMLCYCCGICGWLPALASHGQLSTLTVVFSLLALVAGVFVGVWAFGEVLQPRHYVGIALALLACLLLN